MDRHLKAEFQAVAIIWIVCALCVLLSGCGTATQTRTQDNARIVGSVAGAPVDVTVQRQVSEQSETTIAGPDLAMLAPMVPGGAALGGIAGLAGAAFGAWRMLRERAANKALAQTVAGVEAFKEEQASATVDALHGHLGRAMDEDAKARVRRAKA
jgi:hypothetical protein